LISRAAGSERVSKSGVTGDALKEAAAIVCFELHIPHELRLIYKQQFCL